MLRRVLASSVAIAVALSTVSADALARGGGGHSHTSSESGSHSTTHGGEHAAGHQGGPHSEHHADGQPGHESATHSSLHSDKKGEHPSAGHSGQQAGVQRDPDGRIHRSTKAKDDFKKQHPCPSTGKSSGSCPGYVIDHRVALMRGGADSPSNMQWQTTAAAKAKDKTE